ncbi:antibiotic biosynthesis monooxygenase [Flavobacterium sp. TAB 87]|uniref:antibiotic biosynthesis monooxygenase family protein n=1 Tax=Flavobacterium sp. TAB 87 TaxID=1729581 RepID=UPI00076C2D1F|nr:antibiotic biosynthesis monooxygenase [Flavobacterium sp. TAB 87]KVV14635.1 Antibiotic biosynthesis monooxygenase [Flavobacterium sp. TAB 87]
MILEGVVLFVKKGKTKDFELDFIKASQYISAVEGYLSHTLQKCLEIDNKYLLLVEWNTLESHTIGFRESSAYLQWKELLHHYYEPFPIVEHFKTVYSNKK